MDARQKKLTSQALRQAALALDSRKIKAKRQPYKSKNGTVYDDPVYAHIYAATDKIQDAAIELSTLVKGMKNGEYRNPDPLIVRRLGKLMNALMDLGDDIRSAKSSFE